MSDNKKKKKDKAGKNQAHDNPNKLSKEEDAIARFVRFNCSTNTTMFEGNEVHYFSGKKAVDLLVDSKKYGSKAKVPKFPNSATAEDFMETILAKGLFFRAKKIVLKKKDKTQELKTSKSRDVSKSPKVDKEKKAEKEKKARTTTTQEDEPLAEGGEENETEEKPTEQEEEKKKKKKVKLLFNDEIQAFDVDTTDVYVWIFDPTPFWKKCVGVLMVLGTIGGCLFPLWPEWLRLGVYYLSVTGIGLFGLLLGVALVRTIFFALIWLLTVGRHHIWILPNLMEDCGFFESFQPFYTYEHVPGGFFGNKDENKKKKIGRKSSKDEDEKEPLAQQQSTEDMEISPKSAADTEQQDVREPSSTIENLKDEKDPEEEENEENEDEEEEEEEDGEGPQSDTNSNSWERLSENSSQKSSEGAASAPSLTVEQRKDE